MKTKKSFSSKTFSLKTLIVENVKYMPAITAIILVVVSYFIGGILYSDRGFLSLRTFLSIFTDNAYLGVSAVGMTFVIISGGIDLSVGAVAALTTMIIAYCSEEMQISMPLCLLLALIVGGAFGFFQGVLIQKFDVPPFIGTLAGMFLARGLCFVISIQSITINDPWFRSVASWRIAIPDFLGKNPKAIAPLTLGIFIFAAALIAGIIVLQKTRFGRNVYAIGGNESSAELMGLPVANTRIAIYTINGFCSALAGVVFVLSLLSGYGRHLIGMEMDVIAAVVIGGSLLSGGVGYPIGSLFGIMIQGIILKYISFNGNLSSWWGKIATGVLLFLFIVIQRMVVIIANRNKETLSISKK